MAQNARLGELAGGLITSITGKSKSDSAFQRLKDHAVKGLKDHSHARTNQFEIKERFNGLVEKFAVLNRDDLAEALQTRLDELPSKSRWLPEQLSLLSELSDRPVEHTNLSDVEGTPSLEPAPPPLTWEEIITDEPLDDDGIWDDVERGYHSSGDERPVDDEASSQPTSSTDATSVGEEDLAALARLHVVLTQHSVLDDEIVGDQTVSELVLIRETLMMLHGLPTAMYRLEQGTGVITTQKVALATSTDRTMCSVLDRLASIGTRLNYLRGWTRTAEKAAYIQSVQASVQDLLSALGYAFGELEKRFTNPLDNTVVSTIDVCTDVEALTRPLLHLHEIILRTDDHRNTPDLPFVLLDTLYDEASIAQASMDERVFTTLATVLLAGLRTYLKPVKQWMHSGALPGGSDDTFFVLEAHADCALSNVWHERFALRTLGNGRPSTPAFIHPWVDRAFALGKTRAFLQLLDSTSEASTPDQDRMSAIAVLDASSLQAHSLLPFSQCLDDSLDQWMRDSGMDSTSLVRSKLFDDHRLSCTLHGLEYLFFARNGSLFQDFADALFDRIARSRETWKDQFMLTELAQSTIGSATGVDTDSVVVRITGASEKAVARSLVREMESLELQYVLPWLVQNITRSATLPTHSAVFVLLLQISRTECLLKPELFALRALDTNSKHLSANITLMMKLRWRLAWFVETLHTHTTNTASAIHQTMKAGIEAADGIDSMASVWAQYEKQLPVALLLAPNLSPIKDAVVDVLELCERFAKVWKQTTRDRIKVGSQGSSSPAPAFTRDSIDSLDPIPLLNELDRSISFIRAGLRGVARAGGVTALETLAEKLEWHGG